MEIVGLKNTSSSFRGVNTASSPLSRHEREGLAEAITRSQQAVEEKQEIEIDIDRQASKTSKLHESVTLHVVLPLLLIRALCSRTLTLTARGFNSSRLKSFA